MSNARDNYPERRDGEGPFDFFANQLPDFVWMTGKQGIEVTYCNSPLLRFLGLSAVQEFLGKAWEGYMHPDDVAVVTAIYAIAFRKRSPYTLDARFRQGETGIYKWFVIQGMPRFNYFGEFEGFIGTAHAHPAEETKQRIEQLERSNEDLLAFARVTSHDLQQPLRKVKFYLDKFLVELNAGSTTNASLYLGKVWTAADAMAKTIENILRYSILDGNSFPEEVDLGRLVGRIAVDLEVMIREKRAVIKYDGLPVVRASTVMIYQLFYNLIGNALKFAKVDLPPLIRVSGAIIHQATGDLVRVNIRDNGVGFPPGDAQRIFDEFVRLDQTNIPEGLGIGLALCKKIIERHGGTIEAISHADGAEFIVVLPGASAK
jgi:signal transduction histidine kinase